jgi:hypothetical protein
MCYHTLRHPHEISKVAVQSPYNFDGKWITCCVYLVPELVTDNFHPPYVRLFAKDIHNASQFSTLVDIVNFSDGISMLGVWRLLSLFISKGPDADPMFDPHKINALGIRIDTTMNSTLAFATSIYIGNCMIELTERQASVSLPSEPQQLENLLISSNVLCLADQPLRNNEIRQSRQTDLKYRALAHDTLRLQ